MTSWDSFGLRLAAILCVSVSLNACSMFRSAKDKDDEEWGDPEWEVSVDGRSFSPLSEGTPPAVVKKAQRPLGTSEQDWPTVGSDASTGSNRLLASHQTRPQRLRATTGLTKATSKAPLQPRTSP